MSDIAPTVSETTDIRDFLLEGTCTFEELAVALDVTPRTIYRMRLPYVLVGGKRRAVLALVREQLIARAQGGELPPPRKPGRPRRDSI